MSLINKLQKFRERLKERQRTSIQAKTEAKKARLAELEKDLKIKQEYEKVSGREAELSKKIKGDSKLKGVARNLKGAYKYIRDNQEKHKDKFQPVKKTKSVFER